ncbi:MAG: 30S ribosomal protein S9 [Chloroflexi bacterium]|nr:MAG: 30S ribosomal protein S9 [Chloroflexota bacterium]MBL1196676.1 30S ribosomal protein S9 [Chloroflexota bacterium]NOH13969.1 30S ribosomal protein S9 [Chloroflexota bacterium]
MAEQYYEGIGRRKAASARVRVMTGSGQFTVNEKTLEEFFTRTGDKETILGPMTDSGTRSALDVSVKVQGGGVTGQAGAVRMGLARALVKYNEELERIMRDGGHLTRDPRVKERKKPGLKRARKAPTYTKR